MVNVAGYALSLPPTFADGNVREGWPAAPDVKVGARPPVRENIHTHTTGLLRVPGGAWPCFHQTPCRAKRDSTMEGCRVTGKPGD